MKFRVNAGSGGAVIFLISAVTLVLGSLAAWLTHVIVCLVRVFGNDPDVDAISTALILVIGALLAPVGVIHGILIWFGVP